MTLNPLSAYAWFTTRGAQRPVAWLFTLGVALAVLFLRLESPAWQALLAERQRLYPQLAGKRPSLGDPVRVLGKGAQSIALAWRAAQPWVIELRAVAH